MTSFAEDCDIQCHGHVACNCDLVREDSLIRRCALKPEKMALNQGP